MWEIAEKTIKELVRLINDSDLALPQFQRQSVWGKSNWVPFLLSVLQGRPTGTLLLMETDDSNVLSPRKLDSAPDLIPGQMEYLLLDGQQRTTTLYRATTTSFGIKPGLKKAVVDVAGAIKRGEISEDDVLILPAGQIGSVAEMAKAGKVAFSTLMNDPELQAWLVAFWNEYFEGDAEKGAAVLTEAIPGLRSVPDYRFPVLEIKKDTTLEVVADIFESMNRRGQPLNKFDLMVARMYHKRPDGTFFDLRDVWEQELDSAEWLQRVGVKPDDGMLPLQLIAKQVSRLPKDNRGRVRGLTSGDALELPPVQVIGGKGAPCPKLDLKKAVAALDEASKLLVQVCGVVAPALLPQQAMLIPLADQFLQPSSTRLSHAQMKRWFFAVGLAKDYYGSVNTYADRDCNQLMGWSDPVEPKEPDSVVRLTRSFVENLDLQQSSTRGDSILGTSIFALLVAEGACDWSAGQIPVSTLDEIDFHHVVPDQKLKLWFGGAKHNRRPIAGLTPIGAHTNRSIGSKNSRDVMGELNKDAVPTLAGHRINKDLLDKAYDSKKSFGAFLDDREKRLKEFVIAALGL